MVQHVVVTGGNAGIGRALCKLLAAEHGCHVFMGARDVSKGQAALADIVAEDSRAQGKIEVVQMDVRSDASVAAAAGAVKASLGEGTSLYGLVNNAGVGLAHGVDTEPILDTNLYGAKRVCDAFVPLLKEGEGRVVNMGSGIGPGWMSRASAAVKATLCNPTAVTWDEVVAVVKKDLASDGEGDNRGRGPAFNAYGLSKATLMVLSMIVARTNPGITVATVSPGFIDTAMTRGFGASRTPEQGTHSTRHCLFTPLEGNGWMYGSDGKRSPIDASREPSDPVYTDPDGRGW